MHPLLAHGLEMGVHADGLTDHAGAHVRVDEGDAGLWCQVREPDGTAVGVAWRWPSMAEPPAEGPDVLDIPFLPGLSGVAVLDGSGLTVTWPAPPPATGVPGGAGFVGGGLGPSAGALRDPVAEAWSRYAAQGRTGDRAPRLLEGLERLVRASGEDGWDVVGDERIEGPLEARVVRLGRDGAERSVTLSRALGVSSLVMIEKPAPASLGESGRTAR